MTSFGSITEECGLINGSNFPFIPGLPDDIALLCLARVPLRYHHVLRCVSRRWKALLGSEEWASCRQKNNLEESLIYALCRDNTTGRNCSYVLYPEPASRCWKLHGDVPTQFSEKKGLVLEALGKKLYLFSNCGFPGCTTGAVYCYVPSANKWEEGAPMAGRYSSSFDLMPLVENNHELMHVIYYICLVQVNVY